MVKTRHSGDHEDVACDQYITIPARRTRSAEQFESQINGYNGASEGDDDEMEEQPPPSRRTRAAQRNISIFSGNTTDDETPPRSRRKHHREIQDSREGQLRASGRNLKRHCRAQNSYIGEKIGEVSCRRSTRQRKLMYDTFNQSLIDKQISYYVPDDESCEEIEKPRKRRCCEVELQPQDQTIDMYTRVKCERRLGVKRSVYNVQENEEKEQETAISATSGEEEEEEEEETEEEQSNSRQYFLREHKPRTKIYEAPIEPKRSRPTNIFRDSTPPRNNRRRTVTYSSPARRQDYRKRRKAAFHGSSSTSSSGSSDTDADDEERFERRKAKSMAKSRSRCLPMNISPEDIATGFLRDRVKIGSSLADVDPMNIDRSVTFESVGGLGKHVRALKEMVVFPLLYPEVFERFKITPPRGVLFYGPPGTGKTLVARALANECSSGDRRVAFFMRKGADCLSKWVGESERQLRLLFDQAYQMRPSIIFFDEIDGLAPVRSSRQDQIHSSIVSTLLALMDGLDNRGEIVVIGATNRIDSIDPALRRPGRFDREFAFPLPSVQARIQILKIHTREWKPKLSDAFIAELAEKCAGYCGADLKALCTEACLHALRRHYPQIYHSQDKLLLDVDSIMVAATDFQKAMQVIVPTAQRSMTTPASCLSYAIRPLLIDTLNKALDTLRRIFPVILSHSTTANTQGLSMDEEEFVTDEEDHIDIYVQDNKNSPKTCSDKTKPVGYFSFNRSSCHYPATHRPRLLLAGEAGQGQTTHLAPGIMHHMERLPVHVLDLPALYAVSARTPEEACAQIFREAKRTCPSIIYLPHIGQWWDVIGDTTRATFLTLLQDLDPASPLLFLATNDEDYNFLPEVLRKLFSQSSGEVIVMRNPTSNERRHYFEDLFHRQAVQSPPTRKQSARRALEELPKAPPPQPRQLTPKELRKLQAQEEATLRELRLFLRDVLNKLGRDRKFAIFTKPVDEEEVPDYYDVISNPMDLSTMMHKVDLHQYETAKDFMDDIELIVSNCLEYNPDKDPADRAIRHRACTLKDTAQAILAAELDEEFDRLCEEIKESRKRRGEKATATVPSYYFTKPLGKGMKTLMKTSSQEEENGNTDVYNSHTQTSVSRDVFDDKENMGQEAVPKIKMVVKKVALKKNVRKHSSPWCKSRRRRYKKVIMYVDECGNEVSPENVNEEKEEKVDDNLCDAPKPSAKDENEEAVASEKVESCDDDCDEPNEIRGQCGCRTSVNTKTKQSPPSSRTRRSPRCDQSPSGNSEHSNRSPRDTSKDEDKVKAVENSSVAAQHKEKSLSPVPTTTKRTRSFSGSHSEPEPMDVKVSTPNEKYSEKAKEKPRSPKASLEQSKTLDTVTGVKDCSAAQTSESRVQCVTRQRALEILEQSVHAVTFDEKHLQQLLDKTVLKTEGFNIEQLEKIYSVMSQCIYQHRLNHDKSELLQDLEQIIDRMK